MDKLHMKFSALNVDFDIPSLDFLGSRKLAHEGIAPIKVVILPLLASLSWKWLQIGMDMLSITTSTIDKLFRRIIIDDDRIWTSKIRGFIDFCSLAAVHTPRMNCDEMAGERWTVYEQELL